MDAPLLGPLSPASRGEDENARSKEFAERNNVFMDANAAWRSLNQHRTVRLAIAAFLRRWRKLLCIGVELFD